MRIFMNWKLLANSLIIAACVQTANYPTDAPLATKTSLITPIVRDGCYYYPENDTHDHLGGALKYLPKKILKALIGMPKKAIEPLTSYFYPPAPQKRIPLNVTVPQPRQTIPAAQSAEPVITWIGHASFLIQVNGFNVLTDPVFGDVKVGPITVTKRECPEGIKIEDLPAIDAIVISHNHLDHTDPAALSYIANKYPNVSVFVPKDDKALFESFGCKNVYDQTWWQDHTLQKNGETLKLTCLPAKHWSLHINPFRYRKSLWASWMIESGTTIYFAGDTGYANHFKQIGEQFPAIDVALMPIGPTDSMDLDAINKHAYDHIDAKEAVDAFIELGARCFIPMHWGTFFRGPSTYQYPLNKLDLCWKLQSGKLKNKELLIADCGTQYTLPIN